MAINKHSDSPDQNVDNPSSLLGSVKSVICICSLGATLESFGHRPSCTSQARNSARLYASSSKPTISFLSVTDAVYVQKKYVQMLRSPKSCQCIRTIFPN